MTKIFIIFIILLLPIHCFAAIEEGGRLIKTFNTWQIFIREANNKSHCAIIANPISTTGFPGFRSMPYIGFTSSQGNNFSFSIYSGFVINKDKPIQVFVDDNLFYLKFCRDFFAYTYDLNDDVKLINAALISKSIMRVRVESKNAEVVNDYYDLNGLEKAFAFLKQTYNCS
jgi:hypothetical protein